MKFIDSFHENYVHQPRVTRLRELIVGLLPSQGSLLDVGCGDGRLAAEIRTSRPAIEVQGLDVLVRPNTFIPVTGFDGVTLPYPDGAYDYVMFIDVLHHTDDPTVLLREAARVARRGIILKDHLCHNRADAALLRFMDTLSNAKHNVVLPYNYWPPERWKRAFAELHLHATVWNDRVKLYPFFANWLFGRSLHLVARVDKIAAPA